MAMATTNNETQKTQAIELDCFSPKGGVGKTTMAITLATAFKMNGFKVALYDLDRQRTATSFFAKVRPDLRPDLILHLANDSFADCQIVIRDFPANPDFVPKKGTIVVAPTGSGNFDLHSYAAVQKLENTNTIIKVLNKCSLAKRSDKEALEYFKTCVVISQNSAIENATNAYKTIFNFSHPNSRKAQFQFQYLIDCILQAVAHDRETALLPSDKKKAFIPPEMNKIRLDEVSLGNKRMSDFIAKEQTQ